jgi:acetyl-CoA carboxylase biotin carboxyl carrier protein
MQLEIDKLRALLDLLSEKNVAEFEHEDEKVRFRIVRTHAPQGGSIVAMAPAGMPSYAPPPAAAAATVAGAGGSAAAAASESAPADVVDVTSPFVGTFYRSPSPDAPSFVEVGSVVRPGQTLCIIEAMKLMNEIEAECAGTVVEAYSLNGKAVEFGQKLFRIKKA